MATRLPLGLGLALATSAGTWWMRHRNDAAKDVQRRARRAGQSGRDLAGDSAGWLGGLGEQARDRAGDSADWLGEIADQARGAVGPALGEGARRAGSTAGWARDRAGEIDIDPGMLRSRAAELGARAGETAASLKPVVSRLAGDAGEAIGEAKSQAAGLVGGAVGGLVGLTFRTVRDLTILGAAGAVIVYLYAPEREQQQQLIENAQGFAFGLADLGRGVQQLVDDLRAS